MVARNSLLSEPPTLSAVEARDLLKRQVARCSQLDRLIYKDPEVAAWVSTTITILERVFGSDDRRTSEFRNASGGQLRRNMSTEEIQKSFLTKLRTRRALLTAFIEQIDDTVVTPSDASTDQYRFHSEIEKVSHRLFRDGHYKQAALEAYIRVIQEVKKRVALPDLDGDKLMNKAFGSENQMPFLSFNPLSSEPERDEQRGIMFLFKGLVGLRNAKAHSNELFDSPARAHEYLALASLLMRLLETAGS